MKIIDETGIVLTTEPDLEAGYLVEDVEVIHHDAVEGTAPQWHRETAKLPDALPPSTTGMVKRLAGTW